MAAEKLRTSYIAAKMDFKPYNYFDYTFEVECRFSNSSEPLFFLSFFPSSLSKALLDFFT